MIIAENVYKRFRTDHGVGDWILKDANFTIPKGKSVALIGQNGAGKTTLLRLIAGVDEPTRGSITRDCSVSWPMGLGSGLQGSLTGRQNMKFVARIYDRSDDIEEISEFLEDFSELGSKLDQPVKTYSSGMKARLQFGLSLAFRFDVYISDEMTSVGDKQFRQKAKAEFKKMVDRASLIMVSHGEKTLKDFCEAGILLSGGKAYWFDDLKDALREYNKEIGMAAKQRRAKRA
ncbi:ABC transporter ATP-binding protein [Croceicoccus gelatinilyticus]|uniref:ABC transporter ATP-binding protein n=1 Tax=Croceicoccus gelatinilyticus TaxID=2835536 RepID=UPI001BCCF5B1|nr:ABC transporter ATP-binding protein [Croceicoccus gelatinilyticus]MBS7671197.1 ABC transporter ATP-binding protein [Croceicoccus gelatinilyticus]